MNTYQVFRDSSEFQSLSSCYPPSHQINIQAQTQSVLVPPLNFPKSSQLEAPTNRDSHNHQSSRNTLTNRPAPLPTSNSLDSNPCTPLLGSSRRLSTSDTPCSSINNNNFESTQDLRTFVVTVDLQKINRDRQNQLKLALEDNLRDKQNQVTEAKQAHAQMKQEHEYVAKQMESKTRQLEGEMARQREHISGLKGQAVEVKSEMEQREAREAKWEKKYQSEITEIGDRIAFTERETRNLESELQIMRYECQTTEQTIEIRRRVRMQELDEKIKPLMEEKEQMQLSRDLMLNNLQILQNVKAQNGNEKTMIEEDIYGSGQIKMELIYQREEIEQYIEKTKSENPDLLFISNLHLQNGGYLQNWEHILQQLVSEKQRHLLLDLIRELHQYILGMSSNTTDNSVMQSDELEELQLMIERRTVQIGDAVELVTDFAQNKIKIDLTQEVLQNKLNHVCDQIDEEILKCQLQENEQLEFQMKEIDNKIKVITNRCQNELQPRLKALSLSESQMNDQITKVALQVSEINHTLDILQTELSEVRDDFERTQQSLLPQEELQQDEQLDIKLDTLTQQISLLEIEVQSNKNDLQQLYYERDMLVEGSRQKKIEYQDYKASIEERYQQILEAIKLEKSHALQYEVTNPKIQELTKVVSQLKCDKESAYKRLKYIEARMGNAEESVAHAKQVLDNHILQIQQEQLHQKINQSTAVQFNRRKQSAIHQSTNEPLLQDSKSSQRIEMIPRPPLQDLTNLQNLRKQDEILKTFSHPEQKGQERLHKQFIDPDGENISKSNFGSNNQQSQGICQNQRDAIYAFLKNDKSVSAADLVKYNYESSVGKSQQEDQSQLASSNRQPAINLIALAKSKNIPIQTLITPRENIQEMQYNHSHQTSIVSQPTHYELGLCNQFVHNNSIGSFESLCPPSSNKKSQPFLSRQLSVQLSDSPQQHHQLSHTLQQQHSSSVYHSLYPLPSVKISLRDSHTRSIDDNQRSSFSSSINNFKENVAPNITISAASSTMNMRKLSQATILSQISQNKPPAVPQGKLMMVDDSQSRRQSGVIQKNAKTQSMNEQQFNSNKQGHQVQTKMRMCQNSNNGKILAVGIVDLSRCNQSMVQRDIQFFESIKPLIEGAQFLFFTKHGQCQAKHIFLDFSLLRLYITATSSSSVNADRREILMIENIFKPELPQSTLDLIKQEKSHAPGDGSLHSSTSSTSRRYEFHLILNNVNGMLEKMQLMTKSYDDLRLWIIGLNALIANKNNLMRLSTMIKS